MSDLEIGEPSVIQSHKDLKVWQELVELVTTVYALTDKFPSMEKYGLVSQMRRAAVSVPANIAEGSARQSTKELLNYLSIARGSLAELDTQLEIATRVGFLRTIPDDISARIDEVGRMITGLQRSLRAKLH